MKNNKKKRNESNLLFTVDEYNFCETLLNLLIEQWKMLPLDKVVPNLVVRNTPKQLLDILHQYKTVNVHSATGKFEWIDGLLIQV